MKTIAKNANDFVAAQSAESDATWVGRTVDHLLDCESEEFFDSKTRQLVDAKAERVEGS